MAVVKRAVFLLLLLAVSAYAECQRNNTDRPDDAECENLNTPLQLKDLLHKSFGDWVLVYGVTDQSDDLSFLSNLSSSHIKVGLLDDNETVTYKEWNKYKDGSCAGFFMKTSLAENRADHKQHILPINGYHLEKNGAVEWRNDTGKFQFYQSSDNSLRIAFGWETHRFLLSYVREGHHTNVTQLRELEDRHDRQANCLASLSEKKFSYDGTAEPCSKETPQSVKDHHGGSDPNDQEQ